MAKLALKGGITWSREAAQTNSRASLRVNTTQLVKIMGGFLEKYSPLGSLMNTLRRIWSYEKKMTFYVERLLAVTSEMANHSRMPQS